MSKSDKEINLFRKNEERKEWKKEPDYIFFFFFFYTKRLTSVGFVLKFIIYDFVTTPSVTNRPPSL